MRRPSPSNKAEGEVDGGLRFDDLLTHVAPLGWEHISLTGDYLRSEID